MDGECDVMANEATAFAKAWRQPSFLYRSRTKSCIPESSLVFRNTTFYHVRRFISHPLQVGDESLSSNTLCEQMFLGRPFCGKIRLAVMSEVRGQRSEVRSQMPEA